MLRSVFIKSIGLSSIILSNYSNYKVSCSSSSSYSLLKGYCELTQNGKPCNNQKEDINNKVKGYVQFIDDGKICRIYYYITGLKPGPHGFHM